MLRVEGFWKPMAWQLQLHRFSLANNSFHKHQVLWPWHCYCCILKFGLAAEKKVETKSCSSSGSVREELVTLVIVSVFHNSGNFMGYFSLSLSKVNVLFKNKERSRGLAGRHTLWTWGASGWRGSLQNVPFSWKLMLQHSGFICVDLFFLLWNATFLTSLHVDRQRWASRCSLVVFPGMYQSDL